MEEGRAENVPVEICGAVLTGRLCFQVFLLRLVSGPGGSEPSFM